jgi:EmrB/QacA subfamily drug resistance transporter
MKVSQKWRVAAVVLVGPTLAVMDTTIVSVILSQLQTAFHTDFQTISWVASAYFLAQAAVLPIIGYMSDRIGSKVAFMTALALFTAGSLLCALSPTKEALIAFRVLQGIGGGALLPLSIAINYRNFPPNERSKIMAVLGIPLVLAPTFGPTIGGYLSTSFNWNAVFLINVPLGIIDLLLAFLILPGRTSNQNEQAKGARKSFDVLGLLLSLVGVTTISANLRARFAMGYRRPQGSRGGKPPRLHISPCKTSRCVVDGFTPSRPLRSLVATPHTVPLSSRLWVLPLWSMASVRLVQRAGVTRPC